MLCPLVTVSRLVPSWLISASSAAWEEAARPRTATIAATPIAMPTADSAARSLRVRSPMLASRARSPGRSRAGAGVGDHAPVEHLDAPPCPGGDRVVVGDDDDRGPGRVQLFEQGEDRGAGGRVQAPGWLVGQHQRRRARYRARDRDPLPLTAGQLGRPGGGPVPEP